MRPVSIPEVGPPNIHWLGAAKNRRAPARAGKSNGARERGRPRPHQCDNRSYDPFRFRKSDDRTYTRWVRRRIAALLHAVEKATALGSAAVLGRIQSQPPILHLFQSTKPAP